jgi:hypothetical protein
MLACAAVLLLLLGAAHELTVWVGQAAFATGAMLLWLCIPAHVRTQPTNADVRVAWGLIAAMCLSLGGGVAAVRAGGESAAISSMISVMAACSVVVLAARSCGRCAAVRIGGWAGVYGLFFGVGTLGVAHMTRQVLMLWSLPPGATGNGPLPTHVAAGFGAFAPDAVLALASAMLLLSSARVESAWRRAAGLGLLVAAVGLVTWRLWRLM